jgi:DDE superfamily endonuclease
LKPWQRQEWCLPEVSATFVWRMEDVLDLYAEAYDPARPVVCLDERPVALRADVRPPLPPAPGRPRRRDSEYARCGTACLAVAFEPHRGWRHIIPSQRRTKRDFAGWLKELVEVHYPQAETIRLVVDNLNTHTPAVLYETYPPEEAHRLARKLEFHYTPTHGSWLNMVEIELSVLASTCLDRRIPDVTTLGAETAAYAQRRNAAQATVQWRFTTRDARTKLAHLYPSLIPS